MIFLVDQTKVGVGFLETVWLRVKISPLIFWEFSIFFVHHQKVPNLNQRLKIKRAENFKIMENLTKS